LQQQTATADVLKVISRSAFDLKLVLEVLIESAMRLCGATRGHILRFNGELLTLAAAHNAWPGFTEYLEAHPFRPGQGTIAGRAAAERRTVHVHDVSARTRLRAQRFSETTKLPYRAGSSDATRGRSSGGHYYPQDECRAVHR